MEDKAIKQDEIAKRGLAADIAVHFAEGAGTGVVIQAGNALGKLKPKPKTDDPKQ